MVRLHDGGRYSASRLQTWLRNVWDDGWKGLAKIQQQYDAEVWVVSNGDAVDGIGHHGTIQTVGWDTETQGYILEELCQSFLKLKPSRFFVTRGTSAHVGSVSEEKLGKWLKAERESQHGNWSSHIWRINCRGTLVDIRHHGRAGMRPWTKQGSAGNLASHIAAESVEAEWPVPRLAIRSHRHTYIDSGPHTYPRVIQLPPMQAKTDYAEMVAAEDIPRFGIVGVLFHEGRVDVHPILRRPDPPKTWSQP